MPTDRKAGTLSFVGEPHLAVDPPTAPDARSCAVPLSVVVALPLQSQLRHVDQYISRSPHTGKGTASVATSERVRAAERRRADHPVPGR
jgi:hypothetical protein